MNFLRNDLETLVQDIYGQIDLHHAFFDTLFRSAQQIFVILKASKNLDEFIQYLTEPIYVSDGSGDVYHQLLLSIKMKTE